MTSKPTPGEPSPPPPQALRLGTRATPLAVAQSGWVADALRALGHEVELVTISSFGDRSLGGSLAQSKGVFTAELAGALRNGSVDLVVHSLKDLPTEEEDDLVVACIPRREHAHDVLVVSADAPWADRRGGAGPFVGLPELVGEPLAASPPAAAAADAFAALPHRARLGTSSPRRQAGALELRPDLLCCAVRGSVGRRLQWLRDGAVDAVLLAEAGLRRLPAGDDTEAALRGLSAARLDLVSWPCAPGQGALAIEVVRGGALDGHPSMAALHDHVTATAVARERRLLADLGGGCQRPLGAWFDGEGELGAARLSGEHWRTDAALGRPASSVHWRAGDDDATADPLDVLRTADAAAPATPLLGVDDATDALDLVITADPETALRLLALQPPAQLRRTAALPLSRAEPTPGPWPVEQLDLEGPRAGWPWVLVSSPTAARVLVDRLGDEPDWGRAPWCALGEGTARTLTGLGVPPNLVADAADGAELAAYVLRTLGADNVLLVPHSEQTSGVLTGTLRAAGRNVVAWTAYRTVTREGLLWPPHWPDRPRRVLFTAPSRVRAWSDHRLPWPVTCWALGRSTAEALEGSVPPGVGVQVAPAPTAGGVASLLDAPDPATAPDTADPPSSPTSPTESP